MGVYINGITVKMLREAPLEAVEELLACGDMVDVPEPHGDLIDRAKLSSEMYHEAFETDTDLQRWDSGCWIRYKMFEDKCDSAPTVIEAEEE